MIGLMQGLNNMKKAVPNRKKQGLVIFLLFLIGVTFFIPGIFYYRKAFPEASIDFKISKAEAIRRAKKELQERGADVSTYFQTIHFDYDAISKAYLDREVGIEKMNELLSEEVHLWKWKVRWFKPFEQKEYHVHLSPEGNIIGYIRILPEEEKARSVGQDQALHIAEVFLKHIGVSLHNYSLIEKDFTQLKNRTDFIFTWKKNDFQEPDGEYRISVTIQGDEIGSYQSFFKVSEEWRRHYFRMRSRNQLLQKIAYFITLPLLMALPITLLLRMRGRDVCWNVSLVLSLCIFISHILLGINSIPLYFSQFDTTQSIGNFSAHILLNILITALLYAVIVFIIVGASEPLYREQNPMRLSLSNFLTKRFFKTEEFFTSTIIGYSLALFHIGYVVLFYYLGRNLGIWSPTEIGYTDALSTFLPWIYPLTVSLTASLMEEFIFRVFAISLLRKFLPAWMAVVMPAFLWGFLHSNYPQQPSFIRGIEVGILGIVAGYVFLRWGILATLIWHYTIDAAFLGLFLFNSTNLYFIISGTLVMGLLMIPMLLALFSIIKERRFEKSSGLMNRDETAEMNLKKRDVKQSLPPASTRPLVPEFIFFSRNKIAVLVTLAIASIFLIIRITKLQPWPPIQLSIDSTRAQSLATDHLKRKGIPADYYFKVVTFYNDTGGYEDRYIQNVSGWKGLQEAYQIFKETGRWETRFFIPMNEQEYVVSMDEDGQDILLSKYLPEKAKAKAITKEHAKELVERYLVQERKIPLEEYVLVDSYEDQKPARIDYHFVWRWEKAKIDDGEYRISASFAGDGISHFSKFIKVPDKWARENREEGILQVIFSFLKILMLSIGSGFAILLFARDFMNHKIEWKRVILPPSIAVIFYFLLEMNRAPAFLSDYQTNVSLSNFLLSEILSRLFYGGAIFLGILILSIATLSLYRHLYGDAPLWPENKSSQTKTLLSSIMTGLSLFFIIIAFTRVFDWVNWKTDIPRTKIAPEPLYGIDTFLPFVEISCRSIIFALAVTLAVFFGFFLYKRYFQKIPYFFGIALPSIAIFHADNVQSIREFLLLFLTSAIALILAFLFLNRFIKENVLTCFLALLYFIGVPQSLILLNQPHLFYKLNGLLTLLLIFLPMLSILIVSYKRTKIVPNF